MYSDRLTFTLNVLDEYSRECLAIQVDTSLTGARGARVLGRVVEQGGNPKEILIDNGPEFTSRALGAWAYEMGVEVRFVRPGKPVGNAFIESFNGSFRHECLNQHWFTDLSRTPGARSSTGVETTTTSGSTGSQRRYRSRVWHLSVYRWL